MYHCWRDCLAFFVRVCLCTPHQLVVCPPYLKDLTAQFQLKPTCDGCPLFACGEKKRAAKRSSRPVEGTVYLLFSKQAPFRMWPVQEVSVCVAFSILYREADASNWVCGFCSIPGLEICWPAVRFIMSQRFFMKLLSALSAS